MALVESGKLAIAVQRLAFIFSYRLLDERWSKSHPGQTSRLELKLLDAVEHPSDLRLSDPEHAVSRMLHALATEGYDLFHASTKALELVQEYAEVLDRGLDSRFVRRGAWSYRVWGAASLLSAAASLQENLQPCGVAVLEAAQQGDIPRIMIPSHHVIGGDAVELVVDFCSRRGILAGNIQSDRSLFDVADADVFPISKDYEPNWLAPMRALCDKAAKRPGKILIVEDELRVRDLDGRIVDVARFIQRASQGSRELLLARDFSEAMRLMQCHQIAAIGSDLYMPEETGSCYKGEQNDLAQKRLGNQIVHRILDEFLTAETVNQLLLESHTWEVKLYNRIRSELQRIIAI